jgi:hypothetical protein
MTTILDMKGFSKSVISLDFFGSPWGSVRSQLFLAFSWFSVSPDQLPVSALNKNQNPFNQQQFLE